VKRKRKKDLFLSEKKKITSGLRDSYLIISIFLAGKGGKGRNILLFRGGEKRKKLRAWQPSFGLPKPQKEGERLFHSEKVDDV